MNRINPYQSMQAETSTPEDLVAMLYDGARRFVDKALAGLEVSNFEEVSVNTGKAQRIFTELAATLNFDAGEVAQNLSQLYDYWSWRLGQGLIKRDAEAYREVSTTLMEMHTAWEEAAKSVRAQRRTVSSIG